MSISRSSTNPSNVLQVICRLCAKDEKLCVPIFGDEGFRQQLDMKIRKCLPIIVQEDDELPKQVCLTCLSKLDVCYDLFETCLQAEYKMKQIMNSAKKKNMPEAEPKRTSSMVTVPLDVAQSQTPTQIVQQVQPPLIKTEPREYVEAIPNNAAPPAKKVKQEPDMHFMNNQQMAVPARNPEPLYRAPVPAPPPQHQQQGPPAVRIYSNPQQMPSNVMINQEPTVTNVNSSGRSDRNQSATNYSLQSMPQSQIVMQSTPVSNRTRLSAPEPQPSQSSTNHNVMANHMPSRQSSMPSTSQMGQPVMSYQQPTSTNQMGQPVMSYQQPTTANQMVQPVMSYQQPTTTNQMGQSVMSYQSSTMSPDRRRDQQQLQQMQTPGPSVSSSTCEYCGKSFSEDILDHHRALHMRETFYSCLDCGKNFRTEMGLQSHRNCNGQKKART